MLVDATGVTELLAALGAPGPLALLALTVKVYAVPFVNPETVIGDDAPVPVKPPGLDVTVYPVITAGIPAFAGAVKVTDALALPAVAVPIVGAPGGTVQVLAAIACICCVRVHIPE